MMKKRKKSSHNFPAEHFTTDSIFDFEKNFIHHLSSPLPYRRLKDQTVEEFCNELVKEFEQKIEELGAENVAAFIAEPVLASGGCIVPPDGYFKKIYDVCKKNQIIFIENPKYLYQEQITELKV